MADVDIPKRALFKASEVCEIASLQPYVLRTWESEFPDLGVAKSAGSPRIYRRSDVERVLWIKQLVFVDGLTLAGVRRRIEDEAPRAMEEVDAAPIRELLGRNAKERLALVKKGLMEILDMLSVRPRSEPAPKPRLVAASIARVATPARRKNGTRAPKPAPRARKKSRR